MWLSIWFDSRDTEDLERKNPLDFNAGKTQLVFQLTIAITDGATDVKMDGSLLDEKPSLMRLGLFFSCK